MRPVFAWTLAAGAVLAWQVTRELLGYRDAKACLASEWSQAGRHYLHARVGGPVGSALPPIVLVHGWGIGSSYFVPLAARLARDAQVYVPDLPGHGHSEHAARPLPITELAGALEAWMLARGLSQVVLVGHSNGCQTVLEVAVRRPALAVGLVLVGPTLAPEARSFARLLPRALLSSLSDRPSAALWMARDYARAGARLLAAEMRDMLDHRVEPLLPRVRVPVSVVRGSRDLIAPQAWCAYVAAHTGAPAPTVFRGWGHSVHYDAPAEVARAVLQIARLAG